jgi:hypothetical protein
VTVNFPDGLVDPGDALRIQGVSLSDGWSIQDFNDSAGGSYPVRLTLSREPTAAELVVFDLAREQPFEMDGMVLDHWTVEGRSLELDDVTTDFIRQHAATLARFVANVSAAGARLDAKWRAARERIEVDLALVRFE